MKRKSQFYLGLSLSIGASLFLLSACGKADRSRLKMFERLIEADAEGTYMGSLQPLNPDAGGPISGSVTLSRDHRDIRAYVRFSGGSPNLGHQQKVHVGTSCPDLRHDGNRDNYIDALEAYAHIGGVLIPLDGNISTQQAGNRVWPRADQYGNYWYEEIGSYESFIRDLRSADKNSDDELSKLDNGMLSLDYRVVIIYGAHPESSLPASVARRGRLSQHQSLPVACAVLRKVRHVPGRVEDDPSFSMPTGTADVIGGTGGADDGTNFPGSGGGIPGETAGGYAGGSAGGSSGGGSTGSSSGGVSSGSGDGRRGGFVGGWRWPWERAPRDTNNRTRGRHWWDIIFEEIGDIIN